MQSSALLSVAAFAALSTAQNTAQYSYPYTIDPSSVSSTDRTTWCNNQKAQCPLICLQQPGVNSMTTLSNDCDSTALTYNCVCENNVAPNITQYSQTLPFYICQAWGSQCVDKCSGSNACANACRADHPCGAQSPYKGNTSLPTTMAKTASASGTNKVPVTGFGGAGATGTAAAGTGARPVSLMPGATLGLAAIVTSVSLGFAVFL